MGTIVRVPLLAANLKDDFVFFLKSESIDFLLLTSIRPDGLSSNLLVISIQDSK